MAYDGPTVLALILRTMRPNVRVNVFREIASMKYVNLEKGAMIDFRSTEKFDLKPSNTDAFAECMDNISQSYAYYGMICRLPTTFLPDAVGTYILGDHTNFIKTWNQIGLDIVLNNANMTWGYKTFTDVTPHKNPGHND